MLSCRASALRPSRLDDERRRRVRRCTVYEPSFCLPCCDFGHPLELDGYFFELY